MNQVMKMKLPFILMAIILITLPCLNACSILQTEPEAIELTYSNFFPPTHLHSILAEEWIKEIEKRIGLQKTGQQEVITDPLAKNDTEKCAIPLCNSLQIQLSRNNKISCAEVHPLLLRARPLKMAYEYSQLHLLIMLLFFLKYLFLLLEI